MRQSVRRLAPFEETLTILTQRKAGLTAKTRKLFPVAGAIGVEPMVMVSKTIALPLGYAPIFLILVSFPINNVVNCSMTNSKYFSDVTTRNSFFMEFVYLPNLLVV